jgi:hypothetical protein
MRGRRECRLICCSVYLPYDSLTSLPGDGLERLVRYSEANYIAVVIGCDANSHHVAWGSTDTNRRGAVLLKYIANSNLKIMNRGSEPTFVSRVGEQVIDNNPSFLARPPNNKVQNVCGS